MIFYLLFSWYNIPKNEEILPSVAPKRFDTEWTISDTYFDYGSKPGLDLHLNVVKPILENAPGFPQGEMVYKSSKNTYLGVIPRVDTEFTEVQVSEWITVNTNRSSEFLSMTRKIPARKSDTVLNTKLSSK